MDTVRLVKCLQANFIGVGARIQPGRIKLRAQITRPTKMAHPILSAFTKLGLKNHKYNLPQRARRICWLVRWSLIWCIQLSIPKRCAIGLKKVSIRHQKKAQLPPATRRFRTPIGCIGLQAVLFPDAPLQLATLLPQRRPSNATRARMKVL
ncbi:hypothetical protein BV22DRAFT_1032358, partial [Leucogyrophana mollusca]